MSALPPLPEALTICEAAALREHWLGALDALDAPPGAGDCEVDAAAVLEIDAAGAQLLIALAARLAGDGRGLRLTRPSGALTDACIALGLEGLLDAGGGDARSAW